MIPLKFQALFPSINTQQLDPQKDKSFILESLLHTATSDAWDWMLKNYSQKDITEVVITSSLLTPRDVYYWAYKYSLQLNKIKCLQTNSQQQSQIFWNK